ncbi:DUF2304 domain-containing protein [Clostridium vincentii]|uniref:DUF2304 domain-containing protein n=1 Tax=Clostridium vincentii TaxID=52704 RepID=A0A2T0BGS5_9CLOT|nr:DUF2304 domain-containing protein [Clostridium vincentii]PRR83048.1 hypothetical protein CLVI_12970 [Clostridium vincentii]
MNSKLQIFFIVAIIIYLVIIIHLLKKKKLNLKYTLLWLIAAIVLLIVTIFPTSMYFISSIIGIDTPINSALILAGMFVLIILITLTSIVSGLNQTVRVLTQKLGLLEKQVRDLSDEKKDEMV